MKSDAKPFLLCTARNIPLLLHDKVKQELSEIEANKKGYFQSKTAHSLMCL